MMTQQLLEKLNKEKTAWTHLVIQSAGQLDCFNVTVLEETRSEKLQPERAAWFYPALSKLFLCRRFFLFWSKHAEIKLKYVLFIQNARIVKKQEELRHQHSDFCKQAEFTLSAHWQRIFNALTTLLMAHLFLSGIVYNIIKPSWKKYAFLKTTGSCKRYYAFKLLRHHLVFMNLLYLTVVEFCQEQDAETWHKLPGNC